MESACYQATISETAAHSYAGLGSPFSVYVTHAHSATKHLQCNVQSHTTLCLLRIEVSEFHGIPTLSLSDLLTGFALLSALQGTIICPR